MKKTLITIGLILFFVVFTVCGLNASASGLHKLFADAPESVVEISFDASGWPFELLIMDKRIGR